MNEARKCLLMMVLWLFALLAICAVTARGELVNGSFEQVGGITPLGWINASCVTGWYATDAVGAYDGTYVAYCDPVSGGTTSPTWMSNVTVFPAGIYHLSLWANWARHYGPAMTLYAALGESLLMFDVIPGWHEYSGMLTTLDTAQLNLGAYAAGDDSIAVDAVVLNAPEPSGFVALTLLLTVWAIRYKR